VIDVLVMTWALTLTRVATFIYFLPLIGGPTIPRTVKIGLSMALAVLFYDDAVAGLANTSNWMGGNAATWLVYFLSVAREMLLGGILGFALNLFLVPARVAGEYIAQESGLTFASVLTTTGQGSASPFATIFELIASAVFFTLDLHHVMLKLLQETFQLYPIGAEFGLPNWDLVRIASVAQEGGLMLAAPTALCLMLTTVVLMLLSRAAPQLSLYSIGFPARVIVSLAALLLFLPQLIDGMANQFALLMAFMGLKP
jgi:flagellar biosynthesis protein FliR